MSITYSACPEYPYDLGLLVDSWKIRVCEKNNDSERRIQEEQHIGISLLNETKQYCEGRSFSVDFNS